MGWALTVGRVGGTAVKIYVTFLLLLAWIGFSAWFRQGPAAAGDAIVFIALLFLCVLLHEFGHILTARRFGIETPEVVLLPIGGVASMKRLPTRPSQELLVAIAGPAVNLVIGLALIAFVGALQPDELTRLDDSKVSLLGRLAAANIFLAVFNLIPAFPMDGGRVLHALLSMRLGPAKATEVAASIGQALALALGFLGLFGNPLLIFVAIFVYMAAAGEAEMTVLHEALKGVAAGEAMETRFASAPIDADLGQAVDLLLSSAQHEFPVVDAFGKPIGLLLREDILKALQSQERDAPVTGIMRVPVQSVRPTAPAEAALDQLQDPSVSAICVTDGEGVLLGLLTRQALAEVTMIKTARPEWRLRRAGPA